MATNSKRSQTTRTTSQESEDGLATQEKESSKPDYVIKQYRQLRNSNGSSTRKETIGAAWRDATTGMLTIRMSGVQVISNDIYGYPVSYDFNGQP